MENASPGPALRQFGKYAIDGIAGAGGMGVVYRATDTVLGRTVALKFLPPAFEDDAAGRERFLREAITASALDHPNIGTVFGVEEHEGRRAIVLAYYAGGSLRERLQHGPLPVNQALDIAAQIAAGLAAAHARNIVHRDIKPANILFSEDGMAKVADFGLAKVWTDCGVTAPGATAGTAGYMAPEQITGDAAGPPADVWALGVVLCEMLLGRRPFRADSYDGMSRAVLRDEPDLDGIPSRLAPLLKRALKKKASQRFSSAREMLAEIASIRGGLTGAPQEVTITMAPPARTSRRRYGRLALAAVLLLAGIAGVWLWRERSWRPRARQVAVLPLQFAGDSSLGPLADGLTSLLVDTLRAASESNPRLRVAAASEVARIRATNVAEARRDLGADIVLTGTLVREGGTLRATLNLVNAREERIEQTAGAARPAAEVAGLENDLAQRAEALLGLRPAPRVNSLERLQAASPAAYHAYVEAAGLLQGWADLQNPDGAMALLDEARRSAPENAAVDTALCRAYRLKYQRTSDPHWLDLADAPCRRAPAIDATFTPAWIERGDYRVQRGETAGGIEDLQRAASLDPSSETAARLLAAAYDTAGLHDKARATAQKAAGANPESWNAYYELGEIYLKSGNFDKAIQAYSRATQLAPGNNWSWTRLGTAYSMAEHLPEAERAYQRALAIAPTFAAYNNLANVFLAEQRFAEAGAAYEKALEINPRQDRIWGNLGAAYSRMPGKQAESRDAYRRAAELCRETLKATPDDAVKISNLASYEAFEGQRAEPLERIQKALALAPKDLDVLYNAVETYEYLGFREQALLWIGKMLEQGFPVKDLERSVVLADLRRDSRYKALVAGHPGESR
ncbi:MAG TPA: protein kinase [Bryobacteraceae bacterium]|nr:protein kinase [Bryobacteraceae bacterium]